MFTWIVTGAAGHLGGTIIRLLEERKAEVRGAGAAAGESVADEGRTRYYTGDVTPRPGDACPASGGDGPRTYRAHPHRRAHRHRRPSL